MNVAILLVGFLVGLSLALGSEWLRVRKPAATPLLLIPLLVVVAAVISIALLWSRDVAIEAIFGLALGNVVGSLAGIVAHVRRRRNGS